MKKLLGILALALSVSGIASADQDVVKNVYLNQDMLNISYLRALSPNQTLQPYHFSWAKNSLLKAEFLLSSFLHEEFEKDSLHRHPLGP